MFNQFIHKIMKKKLFIPALQVGIIKKILMIMKISALLNLVFALNVSATLYSQNTIFTLDTQNKTIKEVLKSIEAQSNFRFFYNDGFLDLDKTAAIQVKDLRVEEILDMLIASSNITYKVLENNLIVFTPKEAFQQFKVAGTVTDASSGEPLPGVNIVVFGTLQGVVSDANGKYSLEISDHNAVLVFSYIGFLTQRVNIAGNSIIDIKLAQDIQSLEEVVVVGYGVQKKVNLTGSVGSVGGEALVAGTPTNVISSLQGRLPGVNITQTSGTPGSEGLSILIRGVGTMNNSAPMIIVDGLESRMDNVSPSDIESISVLKDAAASAIYGTRAANGVILVTTKRGKANISEITYRTSIGWQRPTSLPDHLSSAEYAELYNEGNQNQGIPARYSAEDIDKYRSGIDPYNFPNTDWLDLLLTEPGFTQDHNIAFTGGNDITRYRASFEYFDQDGLIKYAGHKRYNLRINVDSKVKKWFTIGLNTALSRNIITYPTSPFSGGEEHFRQTNYIPPTISNKNEDGTWNRYTDGNPIAWIESGGLRKSNNSHLLGSVFGEFNIFKGLTLKNVVGFDFGIDDSKNHKKNIVYGNGTVQGPNSVIDDLYRSQNITLQSFLNYDRRFNKHGIKALLGVSRESSQVFFDQGFRQNFPSNDLGQLNAGSTTGMTNLGWANESKLGSHFGRINYDFDNRYLFEANLRRDASSKFARGNRVGWFPSVSAGWRISEEDFMQNISWISNLKLRGSWGQLGNHRIADYLYIQRITLGQNYTFGGTVADGAGIINATNKNITWETTTETDLGIDVDLFKNKILSVSADYYNRLTDNILIDVPVSMVFGLPAPTVNAGAMRNKGVELLMEHNYKLGELFYGITLNFAYNDNKVEKFANPSKGNTIRAEGVSWDSYYGYQVTGIYQTDADAQASAHVIGAPVGAGDLIFKDQNNDEVINGDDRIVLGNTIPKITFGSNINFKYRNFDLSAFFQGAAKVNRVLGGESFWPFDPENALSMHLDRTIVENGTVVKEGYYPRILTTQKHNQEMSSFSVLNSAYVRMKNVQLGYSIPESLLNKIKIAKARIYISGQNLLTITNFPSNFDPELSSSGAAWAYPQVKFYTFGAEITFK